jgi:hypothetical protein
MRVEGTCSAVVSRGLNNLENIDQGKKYNNVILRQQQKYNNNVKISNCTYMGKRQQAKSWNYVTRWTKCHKPGRRGWT